jgi:glycosyltransferase involved in cell wall biosynthesis
MNINLPPARGTLLIVAGEFPPLKTIGRIRTLKFAEHLRALGWDSIVLTLQPSGFEPNYDAALLAEIPEGVEIVRVPLMTFDERITRLAKRLLGRSATHGGASPDVSVSVSGAAQSVPARLGFFERLQHLAKRWIRLGLDIPDSYLPWALKALPVARKICERRKVDLVFTTLPPFSAAYLGYKLAGETGIPWIADYRDLWYGDVLREWLPPWRQRLELLIEKRWLKRASVIVTVSQQKTDYMRRLHPRLQARWETLTNGYDSEIYAARARTRPFEQDRIEFVYTGRLFKNRRGYAFAEALGRLKQRHPELVAPVRVRILGGVSPEIAARYDAILHQSGIRECFDFPGDVGYGEAMDAQVNCDYLLLIVDTGETSDGVIPGKLFEYVAAKRPIFALCDPGATQQIIDQARLGIVVDAEDVTACEEALQRVLAMPVPDRLDRDEAYLARFDRQNIAADLARLLDETRCAVADGK